MSHAPQAAFQVSQLTKVYNRGFRKEGVRALESLDLHVAPGEIFGLLGPNGAGKTTLVKILLGLVKPSGGTATLLGHSVSDARARERVGYLPENHRFPGFLTGGEMLQLYGQLAGVSHRDRQRRVPELLDLVSMGRWRDTRIKQYSKGMMQRVGIAQAMISDPDVIFLDEPTDGVDPVGRKDIRDILLHLNGLGKTVFINSHLLSEIEQVCTRVAIMNHGRLAKEGTVSGLTSEASNYRLRCGRIPASIVSDWRLVEDAAEETDDQRTYTAAELELDRLNTLIDILRANNVMISAVERDRQSLEDYFIQVVGRESTP